ncbi:SDR family oxidoreductase [Methanolobus psychrotolerans]|uniref:SDR family oxidoreductase n=1 Tax=Methanolobus psychrotolerans TaxID=1874706 RepID=UPI000B9154D5|nr:sugar nucleotide-binding protein [Methanolobus psychrotolerans]
MNVLVIGSTGLLGQALICEIEKRGMEAIGIARSGADFSCDIADDQALKKIILSTAPQVIINCAAIVSLTECEVNPGYAYLVNARPASVISEIAAKNEIYFVQISTDHFYTDDYNSKHREEDPIRLLNEYARTKYAAEKFALTCPNSLVVRTNIVGFRNKAEKPTFVEWAIQNIENGSHMTLFEDYFTSSICVTQFSSALFDIIEKKHTGILNLASSEVTSKKTFILTLAKRMGYELTNVNVGSILNACGNVVRAESNGLDVEVAEGILGYKLPAFDDVITRILEEYEGGVKTEV